MIIGVPKEIKTGEQRVALTPAGVHDLVAHGHRVLIEPGAGTGSGFRDDDYTKEGASLEPVDAVWAQAELILKVKEPIRVEYPRLRAKQILFTYLHLAAVPDLTRALQKSGTIAIAYETVLAQLNAAKAAQQSAKLAMDSEIHGVNTTVAQTLEPSLKNFLMLERDSCLNLGQLSFKARKIRFLH